MKEVLDLEALGYRFRLRRENGVVVGLFYRHPSATPSARVTGPLFAALQPKKWTAVDYLKARFLRRWLEALECWEADPEPANDLKHVRKLAELPSLAACRSMTAITTFATSARWAGTVLLGNMTARTSRIWNGTLHRDLLVYLLGAPLCYDNMDAPIEEL